MGSMFTRFSANVTSILNWLVNTCWLLGYLLKKLNVWLALKNNSSKNEAIWDDYS